MPSTLTPLNPAVAQTFAPPVMQARRWLDGVSFPPDRPLLNLSQAAPVDPPPLPLRQAIADAVLNTPQTHLYGPVLGMPALRAALAARTTQIYGGSVRADQVAITSGCNQAFAAVIATLAGAGDEVIVPVPWYFNHKMWLEMSGIRAVPLSTLPPNPAQGLIPDPEHAATLITPRTRAIALVSPNNPAGVEYPAPLLAAFRDLARRHGLALIVDETYRDFHSQEGAPHALFTDPAWDDTLIHLYSFSKAYRLTGHRVGAIVASPARLSEVEKFLDTVTICPTGLGQTAALWGLTHLDEWLAGERLEILRRRVAIAAGFETLPGWRLLGSGAYFAYVEHPFDAPSAEVAQWLVRAAQVLVLPGSMFMPQDGSTDTGARHLRVAFANADTAGIAKLIERLSELQP
ncbi:aminotransferase [Roseicitreum antarcticum]|uniref:aspartate transaminase n=1 Tax=Roseicitreum antarcticum TaxID=564137 RepID=A0A1H3C766_9RHOB|nr:aminotransferase [Roseicitreum antarcticum]SDX49983.1 Aspartate/methionine/tyrosine aminotransferase [Roseicitreum antarcticum]